MKFPVLFVTSFLLGSALSSFSQTTVQNNQDATPFQSSASEVEYPRDDNGILIYSAGWTEILPDLPAKSHVKRAIAASLTYGAIPARLVAEYDGLHADVQLLPGRPILCVCNVPEVSVPPVLVQLHPKRNFRQLDGGRIPMLRGKIGEATKSDFIEIDVSRPEGAVWLIQPRQALPPGEYALMIGTQNMNIFPFTVLEGLKKIQPSISKDIKSMKGPNRR